MRGIQIFGSGLKWLVQDRTWLTHFSRIGASSDMKEPAQFWIWIGLLDEQGFDFMVVAAGLEPATSCM